MQASLDIYRRGFCCRSFWRLDTLREEPEVVKGGRLEPWGWRREILQELLATDKLVLMDQHKKLESKESALQLLRNRYKDQEVRVCRAVSAL